MTNIPGVVNMPFLGMDKKKFKPFFMNMYASNNKPSNVFFTILQLPTVRKKMTDVFQHNDKKNYRLRLANGQYINNLILCYKKTKTALFGN